MVLPILLVLSACDVDEHFGPFAVKFWSAGILLLPFIVQKGFFLHTPYWASTVANMASYFGFKGGWYVLKIHKVEVPRLTHRLGSPSGFAMQAIGS